ncbi:MAG TPA: hypothetical protein V6D19_12630 [Stenomitos sp.]
MEMPEIVPTIMIATSIDAVLSFAALWVLNFMQSLQLPFRILLALLLLGLALYSGYAKWPLTSILWIGFVFTVAYIQGKWYLWKPMFKAVNVRFWRSLVTTWIMQCIVVLIFFLIGAGIGRVMGR